MTKSELKEMIELLIKVTDSGQLQWNELQGKVYVAEIDGCSVKLWDNYDYTIDDYFYILNLLNVHGVVFAEYNFSQATDNEYYTMLDNLYATIRNSIYKISESERKIMGTLRRLSKEIDNLPF